MGIMTRLQFREELRSQVGLPTTSPVYTDARVNLYFRSTYLHVTLPNVTKHPELETTEYLPLSTAVAYTLANEYREIYSVALVDEVANVPPPLQAPAADSRRYGLRQTLVRNFDDMARPTSRPTRYGHWRRTLELNSIPDTTWAVRILQVRGYILPPDLGDGETTLLSEDWDEVIQAGMRFRYWLSTGQADEIEYSREDYGRLVNERVGFNVLSGSDYYGETTIDSAAFDWRSSGDG